MHVHIIYYDSCQTIFFKSPLIAYKDGTADWCTTSSVTLMGEFNATLITQQRHSQQPPCSLFSLSLAVVEMWLLAVTLICLCIISILNTIWTCNLIICMSSVGWEWCEFVLSLSRWKLETYAIHGEEPALEGSVYSVCQLVMLVFKEQKAASPVGTEAGRGAT